PRGRPRRVRRLRPPAPRPLRRRLVPSPPLRRRPPHPLFHPTGTPSGQNVPSNRVAEIGGIDEAIFLAMVDTGPGARAHVPGARGNAGDPLMFGETETTTAFFCDAVNIGQSPIASVMVQIVASRFSDTQGSEVTCKDLVPRRRLRDQHPRGARYLLHSI